MLTAFIIIAVISVIAFILVNLIFHDHFFGTIVPIILSTIIGVIWTAAGVVTIWQSNGSAGALAIAMGAFMLARAFVEYKTYQDFQEICARWRRR